VLELNNENATGAHYARLILASSSGIGNLGTLEVGINNGTGLIAQVAGTLGGLTSTTGPLVRLEPGSTNTIYVTQSVSVLGLTSGVTLDVRVADDPDERAYVTTRATITIT
jgi:hypothetical protein